MKKSSKKVVKTKKNATEKNLKVKIRKVQGVLTRLVISENGTQVSMSDKDYRFIVATEKKFQKAHEILENYYNEAQNN